MLGRGLVALDVSPHGDGWDAVERSLLGITAVAGPI
jgi:hypothetical protein